jgi:hypothetical protein
MLIMKTLTPSTKTTKRYLPATGPELHDVDPG